MWLSRRAAPPNSATRSSEEDAKKPYVEVSGRKGLGVKADDLLDRLEAAARAEVDERHPDTPDVERAAIAHSIAIGALRYFLLKFTRTATIAFDFKDALSFEGETGPYCQYAVVRARNIFRKLRDQQPDFSMASLEFVDTSEAAELFAGPDGNAFWELAFLAASLDTQIDAAVGAQEPAFVAKYAFQLAQAFNLFYHHHHILTESNPGKKKFLLQLSQLVEVAARRRPRASRNRIAGKNVADPWVCRPSRAAEPSQFPPKYLNRKLRNSVKWPRSHTLQSNRPTSSPFLLRFFIAGRTDR